MIESPFDICACGCDREDHDRSGCREPHAPSRCTAFRLCATADEIQQGYDEWSSQHCEREV